MCFLRTISIATASIAVLLGCTPETKQPVQVMALVRSGENGRFGATQVQLRTMSDVYRLEGSVATLIGGARIVVDPQDPLLRVPGLRDDQIPAVFVKDKGQAPHPNFVQKDGVLWPSDFHTWNMVTTYFNVETAFDYFQSLGVPGETLQALPVYYFPEFVLTELSRNPQRDNALYFAPVKALMVLPFDKLQQAPLSVNPWVVGHEYAHVVFNKLVYGNEAFPVALTNWSQAGFGATPQANALKALDEGLADFLAFGVSCRTAFGCDFRGAESSFDESFADARDISRPNQCMDPSFQNALDSMRLNEFTSGGFHYKVGTVLASALYQSGKNPQDWEVLQKSVISAYPALRETLEANLETPQNFSLASAADLILAQTTSLELRTRLCGQLLGRLKLRREALPSCPIQAIATADCP